MLKVKNSIENVQEGLSRVSGIDNVALAIPKAVEVPGNLPACRAHDVAGSARVIFRILSAYLAQRLVLLLDLRREEKAGAGSRWWAGSSWRFRGPTIGDTWWGRRRFNPREGPISPA